MQAREWIALSALGLMGLFVAGGIIAEMVPLCLSGTTGAVLIVALYLTHRKSDNPPTETDPTAAIERPRLYR